MANTRIQKEYLDTEIAATSGTINGVVIGGTSPAAVTGTTITGNSFIPNSSTIPTNGLYLPASNTLGLAINSAAEVQLTSTALSPAVSNGNALGTSSLMWSDLFLANGARINFNNGNMVLTHSSGVLTLSNTATGATGPILEIYQDSASPAVADEVGALHFYGRDSAANKQLYGGIKVQPNSVTSGSELTKMTFIGISNGGLNTDMMTLVTSGATATLTVASGGSINIGSVAVPTISSTNTFTNKTFDANGTGNVLSNVEIADFAASAIVTAADTIAGNDNDTTVPTTAAVIDYVSSGGTKARVRAYKSGGNQQIDASFEKVTFESESYDVGGDFNTTTSVFTAPRTGYYQIAANGDGDANSSTGGIAITVAIYKNGSIYSKATSARVASSARESGASVFDVLSLTASDTIEIYAISIGGETVDFFSGEQYTYLNINEL